MYMVFLKYPEALRPAFPRLKEKLEDPDPGKLDAPHTGLPPLVGPNLHVIYGMSRRRSWSGCERIKNAVDNFKRVLL